MGGYDIAKEYKQARKLIGLVPQELIMEPFATVSDVMKYTRGYYGLKQDDALMRKILIKLSL